MSANSSSTATREVWRGLEGRLGGRQELLVADGLLVAHGGSLSGSGLVLGMRSDSEDLVGAAAGHASSRSATRAQLQRRSTAARAASPSARRSAGASPSSSAQPPVRTPRHRRSRTQARCRSARRVLLGDARGDLGEPRVVRDERRHARGRRLGRDHAEGLGEDRRHDGDVDERQQVHEVAVLERAGEERARRCERLERLAVVAEADDHARARRARRAPSRRSCTPLFSISFPK